MASPCHQRLPLVEFLIQSAQVTTSLVHLISLPILFLTFVFFLIILFHVMLNQYCSIFKFPPLLSTPHSPSSPIASFLLYQRNLSLSLSLFIDSLLSLFSFFNDWFSSLQHLASYKVRIRKAGCCNRSQKAPCSCLCLFLCGFQAK